jgi:hypothetical protein
VTPTEPVPDCGGYPDHRAVPPVEHQAYALLRRIVMTRVDGSWTEVSDEGLDVNLWALPLSDTERALLASLSEPQADAIQPGMVVTLGGSESGRHRCVHCGDPIVGEQTDQGERIGAALMEHWDEAHAEPQGRDTKETTDD